MDAVITYVNGEDKAWIEEYKKYVKSTIEEARYRDWGTLQYVIKGIRKFMPFVEHIYLIVSSPSQITGIDVSELNVVYHKDIIPEKYLPTFNSCTIEMFLHKIPGLSEEFIYFNDDTFVVKPVKKTDFFIDGKPVLNPHLQKCSQFDTNSIFVQQCKNSTELIRSKFVKKYPINVFIRQEHIMRPMLKSTYEGVWKTCEKEIINSLTRIRTKRNYNAYLFNNYDVMTGWYVLKGLNYKLIKTGDVLEDIINEITSGQHDVLCINDNSEINYTNRQLIFNAFEDKLNLNVLSTMDLKLPLQKEKLFGKIIVTLTTWKGRIAYCMPCLKSITEQTVVPDLVYINLSVEEFPNKENDLPEDFINFVKDNDLFKINWVEGRNTKTMKKVFPILKYLNDEDVIVIVDDDIILPKELIKSRVDDFKNYNLKYAVSSNFRGEWCYCNIPNGEKLWTCASTSLIQKRMLNNFEKILTEDIINTYTDDCVYTLIAYMNGYKFKQCSDYARQTGTLHKLNEEQTLQNTALRKCQGYFVNSDVVKIFEKDLYEKYGIYLNESYKFFCKKIIVSFTSYPKRTNNPEIVKSINSIINQSLKPDKIVMYLSKEEYTNELNDLNKNVLDFYYSGKIDIQFIDKNLKPNNKWFYAFQDYKDALVLTVDDDIIYPNDLIESLYNEWEFHKKCIIASRCHLITYDNNGCVNPYKEFIQYKNLIHSYKLYWDNLFFTGVGGVLYDVSLFKNVKDLFNKETIQNSYLTVDDVYLNKIANENKIPVICLNKYNDYAIGDTVIESMNDSGLWKTNLKSTNDIAISLGGFNKPNNVNVCYITDKNYIDLTTYSINTLIKNVSVDKNYNIFVLYTDLPLCTDIKTPNNVNIINIKIDINNIIPKTLIKSRNDVIKHVTSTALIKFIIPDIFQNFEKILYIDCDTIIKKDISIVYESNIDDYSLGVVSDDIEFESYEKWCNSTRNPHSKSIYFNIHDKCIKEHGFYFNSGVLLFNIKKLRLKNISSDLICAKENTKTTFVDQDIFNLCLGKDAKLLSMYYNYYHRYGNVYENNNIVILHIAEKLNREEKLKLMKSLYKI